MNPWIVGTILTLALIAGGVAGWNFGKRSGLRMPNAAVATVVLVLGSLGGPLLTYRLLGPGIFSYVLALLIAGVATGFTLWPMGERQGEREWL